MANEENLKPTNTLTKSERRALARKAGKASGKARRKKADLKKVMKQLLELNVADPEDKEKLENLGLDDNNQSLLVLQIFRQALEGNQKAVDNVIKLTVNKKDEYDVAEQKAKTKLMEQQLETGQPKDVSTHIHINDPWRAEAEEKKKPKKAKKASKPKKATKSKKVKSDE